MYLINLFSMGIKVSRAYLIKHLNIKIMQIYELLIFHLDRGIHELKYRNMIYCKVILIIMIFGS